MFNKDCNENNLLSFKEEYDVFWKLRKSVF